MRDGPHVGKIRSRDPPWIFCSEYDRQEIPQVLFVFPLEKGGGGGGLLETLNLRENLRKTGGGRGGGEKINLR